MKNRLPPKNYRRIALPPKKYRIFWFTASAKVVTAKNEKPAKRLKLPPYGDRPQELWQLRPQICRWVAGYES